MAADITVLFNDRKITVLYSMYPFWVSRHIGLFKFTTNLDWVLKKDKNQKILLVGWFQKQDRDGKHKRLLSDLREKYKKIFFFDDNDGSESHFLDLLPYIDKYYKKQLFKDRKLYATAFYGKRIFTDFYHREFGADEGPAPEWLPKLGSEQDLEKMTPLWNLAYGQYPVSKRKHKYAKYFFRFFGAKSMKWILTQHSFEKIPTPTTMKCQARFGYKEYRPLVGFQRKILLESVKNSDSFLSGRVPFDVYNKEVKEVIAILSPFGWGEVCFRDFEAIFNGAVLVKPDMSHVETWPNIFVENVTYIPVHWSGEDVVDTVDSLLLDKEKIERVRNAAWEMLSESYRQIDDKVRSIVDDFGA
jgi:hypothetical protein